MNRFRPNITVSNCTPYEEDSWKRIKIGSVIFRLVKPCSRCILINVDQATGESSLEPLQTLTKYRKQEKGVMFGQNLVPETYGPISLNDSVKVLGRIDI